MTCTVAAGDATQNCSDFGLRKFMNFHWKKVIIHELALQLSVISVDIFDHHKNPIQNSFDLSFFLKWCCKISIMQFYKLFKKIIWKDIHILQDDCINKALPFAKISSRVCWWIWIFLSFLRKFHGSDFIPIGTLWMGLK